MIPNPTLALCLCRVRYGLAASGGSRGKVKANAAPCMLQVGGERWKIAAKQRQTPPQRVHRMRQTRKSRTRRRFMTYDAVCASVCRYVVRPKSGGITVVRRKTGISVQLPCWQPTRSGMFFAPTASRASPEATFASSLHTVTPDIASLSVTLPGRLRFPVRCLVRR